MNKRDLPGGIFVFLLTLCGLLILMILMVGLTAEFSPAIFQNREPSAASYATAEVAAQIEDAEPTPSPPDFHETYAGVPLNSAALKSTEEQLKTVNITQNDLIQLAEKYHGVTDVPVMLKVPPPAYPDGSSRDFWVLNVDSNAYRQIRATLVYQTPHAYFWVEEGVDYNREDVLRLVDAFENQIYPRNRFLFGDEFSPGVDNDVRLTILYADQLGGAAGYYSSADSYPAEIKKFSNRAEMFYLSAEHINLSSDYAYGVMAHEFQHMIHWFVDRDEEAWINEGLSELAVGLNGFNLGGFTTWFVFNPDLQLNFWPGSDQGSSIPHYGASYLFIKYLHQKFGSEFIRELVSQPENGFAGLERALQTNHTGYEDDAFLAESLFQKWTVANYLDPDQGQPEEFSYRDTSMELQIEPTDVISCGDAPLMDTVSQFGADYIEITCDGNYEIVLDWNDSVAVLPVDPHSGRQYVWSNRGDESVMRLSRVFDLTGAEGPIDLAYWTWYDIERDYDYLYVNVSENGTDWQNLTPPSCSRENPTGANYGCGYNGKSQGWKLEEIDLSQFAGRTITIQFEYVTDAAVNGDGFVIDDVAIEAIHYFEDFEGACDGWVTEGFVQIENSLPQRMGITFWQEDGEAEITRTIRHAPSSLSIPVKNTQAELNEVLILSGLSRFTHLPANYRLSVRPMP